MEAILLKTNGTEVKVKPKGRYFSLKELQGFVGGYIEIHKLQDGREMILNEEGILLNLPINESATVLAYHLATSKGIRGDVLVTNAKLLE